MKRLITLILLLALFSGMLTGCDSLDGKYRPKPGDDYKWVCDEIDMWFQNKVYPFGELTLGGETKTIAVWFMIGGGTDIEEFFSFDDRNYPICETLFSGRARFHKKWFSLKVDEDYIDYVGFEKLTFRRMELDEEDLAWIENFAISVPEQ